MDLGLQGKVAAITGGSEGVGKAAAIRFAQEGAKVAICARRPDVLEAAAQEVRAAGGEVLALSTDVLVPGQVEAFIQRTIDTFGGLDILVNNVGTSSAMAFESVTDETWQEDFDLKLFSAIRASRTAIPSIRARGGGRIINITTVGGKHPGASSVPTTVTRAAGIALTKALSKDLAKDNILVNTVCISLAKSGQTSRNALRRFPGRTLEDAYAEMGKNHPLGRIGEAEEVGDVIVFLASARASFVSGASVNVDGGISSVV